MEEKILIISYFFPPRPTTGATRVKNIADFLSEKGITPIVVTGDWQKAHSDKIMAGGGNFDGSDNSLGYPVFYEKDEPTLRLRLYRLMEPPLLKKLYSVLVSPFLEILELQFPSLIFYRNIYRKAVTLLENNPSIKHVFISMAPFNQAAFGYLLKKQFPHINWVADYRDDWSTSEVYTSSTWLRMRTLQHYEKKYLSNCGSFCSVSEAYVNKIQQLIGKKGFLLANGFDDVVAQKAAAYNNELFDDFTITFNGTLYNTQPVEFVLDGLLPLWEAGNSIYIKFIGTGADPSQTDRIMRKVGRFSKYVEVTGRVSREIILDIQLKSHLLLAIGHVGLQGVVGSKTYEYIGLKKKVLIAPTDNDVIETLLTKTGQGYVCKSVEECTASLNKVLLEYKSGTFQTMVDYKGYEEYSRKYMLNSLLKNLYS